jgi:hypothetical protein
MLLSLIAFAAGPVDLSESNYAMRLAPKYLAGERPGAKREPCLVSSELAQALSRAQDGFRLRELFIRVEHCAETFVDASLEDRSGSPVPKGEAQLDSAMGAQGFKRDPARPRRYLR